MKKYAGSDFSSRRDRLFSDRIIDNSRSMLTIINRDYKYEKVNKPFCRTLNGPKTAFIGKTLASVWGDDVFSSTIKKNIDTCLTGRTIRYEAAFSIPGSEDRHFEVVFRPVRTSGNEVTHVMAETFDITELHKSRTAAEEVRKEFSEMEASFKNRLKEAQRLESIGVLAGGIAHDFNNILATVSGYAEMLHEDVSDKPSLAEKTLKILSAVNKARLLINQILTFSRNVEQEKVIVDLNKVLRETVGFVRSAAKSGLRIRTEYCGESAFVYADPTQLFRVFLNLMTNAIQSMEGNEGRLLVRTSIIETAGSKISFGNEKLADSYVLIRFRDNGKGMDQVLIPRIFEPFFTSHEIGKGTGLGLSVVHGIVSDLEGGIAVKSKPGRGSVFDIYLPLSTSTVNPGKIEPDGKRRQKKLNRNC